MKPKMLICGATGFVGRNMVEHFARLGLYEIHAVHFTRQAYPCAGVIWHQADLRDPHAVQELLQGMDILIQAAATTSGVKDIATRPAIHVTDNAVMNSYLFRAAHEASVKHVVFFSCTVMYPSSEIALREEDFDANTPLHPRYFGVAHTKLYLEKTCAFFASLGKTKFTAIRHSNIFGAYDKFDLERSHVFGATVSKVMTAKDHITLWGTGEEARDLLHADDLAHFVELAIARQPLPYRLYNCGRGKAISVKELAEAIISASGKNLIIQHDFTQPSIKTSVFVDCALAEAELRWKPAVSLEDGIARTLAWWRDHIDPETLHAL